MTHDITISGAALLDILEAYGDVKINAGVTQNYMMLTTSLPLDMFVLQKIYDKTGWQLCGNSVKQERRFWSLLRTYQFVFFKTKR